MKKRPTKYLWFSVAALLVSILLIGLYRDNEFNELYVFTKYRPSFKMYFYSPIGEGDYRSLPLAEAAEYEAYQRFVVDHNTESYNASLPYVLVQLTISLFCFGIWSFIKKLQPRWWRLLVHASLFIFLTNFILIHIMVFDHIAITCFGALLILGINLGTAYLFVKKKIA